MNYRDFLQKVIYAIINPLIKGMIAVGITPNIVTFVGFLGNIVAAGFFLDAAWMLGTEQADYASCMVTVGWGGFIILAAGLFDMMDGRLARMSGKSSLFGALWDSTLDRYSELVSLFGICLIFVRMQGDMPWFWMGVVSFAAMIGSVILAAVVIATVPDPRMNLIAVAIRSGRIMIGCVLSILSCLFLTCFVIYFAVSTSTASLNVVTSPTFPGKITYGVRGNLLSSPVCHTGIPGLI